MRKGMLLTENNYLSQQFSTRLLELVYTEEHLALKTNGETKRQHVLSLFSLVKEQHQNSRCTNFFNHAVSVIKKSDDFLEMFESEAIEMIETLTQQVKESPIVEQTKSDIDFKL